jgi:glycosyltransferase involved in cell wall biosynthesis
MHRFLVDGRVFSSSAHDRGMGKYVRHVIELLKSNGYSVMLLLFRDCYLERSDPMLANVEARFANYEVESAPLSDRELTDELHGFTTFLSSVIEDEGCDIYIDATPFLRPLRADLLPCTVMAVFYDLIPLKYLSYYLPNGWSRRVYINGLTRVSKADGIISISETTANDAIRYLGIRPSNITVIYPTLDSGYALPLRPDSQAKENRYLFAILGSHKSKNPEGSLKIYKSLLKLNQFRIRVNAPKADQLQLLQSMARPDSIIMTSSLTDDEKIALQRDAIVVAHLSVEEGFGIPFLEALFLGTKVIALDIPMNHEIVKFAKTSFNCNVFLVLPDIEAIDLVAFEEFLNTPPSEQFTKEIREGFSSHWKESTTALTAAADRAIAANRFWLRNVEFKIFSSVPGTSCGVADYSVAYVRSTKKNVAFFFAEGNEQNLSHLQNVKTATFRDFERLSCGVLASVPSLFNFAFSPALNPGIGLMREHGTTRDAVLVHEREYFGGLNAMMAQAGQADRLVKDFLGDAPHTRERAARSFIFHPTFNNRSSADRVKRSPVPVDWLKRFPGRFISHLSPDVLAKMQQLAKVDPTVGAHDLAGFEERLEFVPLGIDQRSNPAVIRAASRMRTEYCLQQDDVLVGHFGLVIGGDLKQLPAILDGIGSYIKKTGGVSRSGKRLFFALVGRILDMDLFEKAQDLFDDAGLSERLIYANPALETDFDVLIAACDAVFCLRRQSRGQLSHIYVRALSLGVPLLVNRDSGYSYDERITLRDEALQVDMHKVLDLFMNRTTADLRRRAAQYYDAVHRGDKSLNAILKKRDENNEER